MLSHVFKEKVDSKKANKKKISSFGPIFQLHFFLLLGFQADRTGRAVSFQFYCSRSLLHLEDSRVEVACSSSKITGTKR